MRNCWRTGLEPAGAGRDNSARGATRTGHVGRGGRLSADELRGGRLEAGAADPRVARSGEPSGRPSGTAHVSEGLDILQALRGQSAPLGAAARRSRRVLQVRLSL